MMLDRLGPFPVLLLLLGSWAAVLPPGAWTQPPTRVQKFIIQHLSAGPVQCNIAMRAVNNLNQTCKDQNTFLHDNFPNVTVTCGWPNRNCRNGQNNCHQSTYAVGKTHCSLTGGRFPNCSYRTTPQHGLYIVACDPRQRGYPPNCLFPVHLD
uniref:Ribonuclease A-domain domain-containing protein n=2 Tax=Ailuropoda melanoleuca TaxID=9646 RepID=G1MNE3_AILME